MSAVGHTKPHCVREAQAEPTHHTLRRNHDHYPYFASPPAVNSCRDQTPPSPPSNQGSSRQEKTQVNTTSAAPTPFLPRRLPSNKTPTPTTAFHAEHFQGNTTAPQSGSHLLLLRRRSFFLSPLLWLSLSFSRSDLLSDLPPDLDLIHAADKLSKYETVVALLGVTLECWPRVGQSR